jgi:DNA polymerase elongation subunit (family B)
METAAKDAKRKIKIKKPMQGRSFRLIDFHVCDDIIRDDLPSDEDGSDDAGSAAAYTSNFKEKQFVIQMFGINEKGETCSMFIRDFSPFFYIKIGDNWTRREVENLLKELRAKVGATSKYVANCILSAELMEYHKLYGFTGGKKDKFCKVTFKTMAAFNKVRNLWYSNDAGGNGGYYGKRGDDRPARKAFLVSQNVKLELYESKIPPLLRYFHIYNISPSGWVFIPIHKTSVPPAKSTTCLFEFICKMSDIIPQPNKETRVPYKIASFDIEASSSHGDFPVPKKSYKRLATNMVDVVMRHLPILCSAGKTPDKVRLRALIERIVRSAFGYGKFDDVDLVYPKCPPSKARLESNISEFLDENAYTHLTRDTCKNVLGINANGSACAAAASLFTIEDSFEKMKYAFSGACAEPDAGEDDAEQDEGDVAAAEPQIDEVCCGEDDAADIYDVEEPAFAAADSRKPAVQNRAAAATQRQQPQQPRLSVQDVFCNEDLNRDKKIQVINEIMSDIFPALEGDKVTFIGTTFMRYGEPLPYLNHCLVLDTCDEVPNAVIETAEKESDLLVRWTRLIQEENPDIVIGYNIFGFDYEFMFQRALENDCEGEFLLLARNADELGAKKVFVREQDSDGNYTGITGESLLLENTKIVLATGEYDLKFPKMTGRIQIDMYTYFRRDFNLSSYKLDDVAGQFISDDIKMVAHTTSPELGEVTELFTKNIAGLNVNDYIHIEISGFTSDYFKDGFKFPVLAIERNREVAETAYGVEKTTKYNVICIAGHESLDATKSIKWCMAKDDVTPQDIFKLSNGSSADRARVAKYCIQDCNLVHHLMNKIDVITGYVEMSRICSVPVSFLVLRGQGIKLTSFVAKKCREKETLMPDLDKTNDGDGYEGAIVLPPKCSMYMDNPVACVDYSSLYPSSIISQNYSHDSKVWTKEYDNSGNMVCETGVRDKFGNYVYDNLEGYKYIDIEFDIFQYKRNSAKPSARALKTKVGYKVCRWAQLPNHQKSIMPSILEELLKARADTRKLIKSEADPFMQNILDKRQLGYKVTANSLYGQCGAKTSTFYEKDVAASTTATGRMMITYAKRIIEDVYGDHEYETERNGKVKCLAEYVYGDSVAAYTPVYLRVKGKLCICAVEEVAGKYGGNKWAKCIDAGRQDKEVCELFGVETWSDKGWTTLYRVIRHALAPHKRMWRVLTHTGLVDVTDDHSLLTPDGDEISPKEADIGTELLHCPLDSGLTADFEFDAHCLPNKGRTELYNYYSHVEAAKDFYKTQSSGYSVILNCCEKNGYVNLFHTKMDNSLLYNSYFTKIKKILPVKSEGEHFVYDLTTDNHHFAAGIGNMIVHNTDSVFFTFNLKDPETGEPIRGKRALEITIEIAQDAAALCSQFLKPPMELSYEKTLMPFILLSKKRYVGMLYENDPRKGKMKYMGLSLKRRDSCDYLKDTYGGALEILMNKNDIQSSLDFVDSSLRSLIEGNVTMDKLVITKALRGYYKNPAQIAHNVLAERIGKREEGKKPKPGDRIKFVHIVSNNARALQGEKIETPDFIIQNKIPIDYTFYITNQLLKPLSQLFGLALDQILVYQSKHSTVRAYKKELDAIERDSDSLEEFMKKKEKYCSAKVKALLFDKYLTEIFNKQNGIQTIQSLFSKVPKKT